MRIAPVAEVKARLSHYLDAVQEGPVIVTRNGRPVAVLAAAPAPDDLERFVLAHTPRFRRLLDEAERRIAEAGGVPHEAFWAAVEAGEASKAGEAGAPNDWTEAESHGPSTAGRRGRAPARQAPSAPSASGATSGASSSV